MATELDADSSGHGVHHAWRVFELGTRLADAEGADPAVVGGAALTHDLHRVRGGEEYVHPEETLDAVREILEDAGFPEEKIPAVQHCVAVHEDYGFDYGPDSDAAETVEAAVLQDADNLDAIGAVGVARAFTFAGARGNPAWMPERDGDVDRDTRLVDGLVDAEGGTLSHFEDKLLHLCEDVNTEAGRELAEERHAFLAEFVERFRREWFAEA